MATLILILAMVCMLCVPFAVGIAYYAHRKD